MQCTALQGMGRHSLEEVVARMRHDFECCEVMLARSGAFLSGPTITPADCFLWALLDMVRSPALSRIWRMHTVLMLCVGQT